MFFFFFFFIFRIQTVKSEREYHLISVYDGMVWIQTHFLLLMICQNRERFIFERGDL